MNRLRLIGLLLTLASTIGLIASIPAMADRLSHRDLGVVWFNEPITDPEFRFHGEQVRILTLAGDEAGAQGRLEIHWRDETRSFEIEEGMRDDPRLPGLLRHDDWLRVLVMAQGARSEQELTAGLADGTIHARLIVVMRLPAAGFDPGSWGSVRRKEWRYRFVELLPREVSPDRAFDLMESTYAELDPLGDPKYLKQSGRAHEAWKYAAMQQVTPATLIRSKSRPIDDAMQAMGWTWTVAGLSVMGLVVGVVMMAISRVK